MEIELSTDGDTLSAASGHLRRPASALALRAFGRARSGDRDALRFLYARYADEVYGHACTLVADGGEAREVTQRAFAEIERLIVRYDGRDVSFLFWIRRVVRDVAAQQAGL
ncbi:MAG TPA: sigma factor [Solirubrobacteraceae bacterium]|jgi:DNA-directed RNA polymerase specialized sigma24 family protein